MKFFLKNVYSIKYLNRKENVFITPVSLKFNLIASRVELMNYLIYFVSDIILYYDILPKKKKKKKDNVNSYFVEFLRRERETTKITRNFLHPCDQVCLSHKDLWE